MVWDGNCILPPCGRCRETVMQINHRNSETDVVIAEGKVLKLEELLPHSGTDKGVHNEAAPVGAG